MMNTYRIHRTYSALSACLVILALLSSCYESSSDDRQFGIFSTLPDSGATDVSPDVAIIITLNTDIDPATATSQTVQLRDASGNSVIGEIYAGGVVLDFRPKNALATNSTYTMTLDSSLAGLNGETLGSDYTFSFTTGTGTLGEEKNTGQ